MQTLSGWCWCICRRQSCACRARWRARGARRPTHVASGKLTRSDGYAKQKRPRGTCARGTPTLPWALLTGLPGPLCPQLDEHGAALAQAAAAEAGEREPAGGGDARAPSHVSVPRDMGLGQQITALSAHAANASLVSLDVSGCDLEDLSFLTVRFCPAMCLWDARRTDARWRRTLAHTYGHTHTHTRTRARALAHTRKSIMQSYV